MVLILLKVSKLVALLVALDMEELTKLKEFKPF